MIELIKKVLSSKKDINDWKLLQHKRLSSELFYVSKRLETNRVEEYEEYTLTVYVDQEGKRGTSNINIDPYMDENEINSQIDKAIFRAKFVKDNPYGLPSPSNINKVEIKSNIKGMPLMEVAEKVSNAIFSSDAYKDGYLSATEIFIYQDYNRILNSKGIDEEYTKYHGMIETIPTWKKGEDEFEIYEDIVFSDLNEQSISKEIDRVLQVARDRCNAVKFDINNKCKVLISSLPDLAEVYATLANELSYAAIVQNVSTFKLNESIQGDKIKGDKINISKIPFDAECVGSRPIDEDGMRLTPIELIKDGIPINYFGSFRWGDYLGIKEKTGNLPISKVSAGSKSIKEMKSEPYLECVSFSGIQVDPFSDYIGGEVRLGYYYDGNKVIPVTGFSIGGSLKKFLNNLYLSKEIAHYTSFIGPSVVESSEFSAS